MGDRGNVVPPRGPSCPGAISDNQDTQPTASSTQEGDWASWEEKALLASRATAEPHPGLGEPHIWMGGS